MHRWKVAGDSHGCDYPLGHRTLVVSPVETAHPLQVRYGSRGPLRHSHHPQVRQDVTDRNVDLCGPSFTPGGHRACDVPRMTPELPCLLDPLPGIFRNAPPSLTLEHLPALLFRPRQSAVSGQPGDLAVMDLQQVGHVGGRIVHLRTGQRPRQPVGEAVPLW